MREVHTDDGTLFLWPNTHTEISPRDVESQRGEGMKGRGVREEEGNHRQFVRSSKSVSANIIIRAAELGEKWEPSSLSGSGILRAFSDLLKGLLR